MNAHIASLAALIVVVLAPYVSWAQPKDTRSLTADVSVPESPAFTILGLSPQSVVRPSNTQELGAALLNGVDKNGNFQTGLAVDFTPYSLLYGDNVTLGRYQENANGFNIVRQLWRLQTSLATAKGATTDDKSVRVALGFRLTPWDLGDPRLDSSLLRSDKTPGVVDCLRGVARAIVFGEGIDDSDAAQVAEATQRLKRGSQACRERAAEHLWNNSSFSLGGAPSWISKDGSADHLTWNGAGAWASLGYGFEGVPGLEDFAQLIVHARYHVEEQVPDAKAKGQFLKQDSTALGGRLRVLLTERFNLSLEGLWIREEPVSRATSDSTRVSIAAEYRLASGLWLEFSVGGEGGRRDGNNQAFALGTLKWGTSKEPTLPTSK